MYCHVENIVDTSDKRWFLITESETGGILREPTKYLKHKDRENCSPNTVKKIAFSIAYYLNYLAEQKISIRQVLQLRYMEQHEHFVAFLYWLKEGNHTTDRSKRPNNTTCNSYLQAVFGYYEFLQLQYDLEGEIKVLQSRTIGYGGLYGVRYHKRVSTFRGYLTAEGKGGKTIAEEKIRRLLSSTDNIRNKLLLLLPAETGFRIGEVLGIRYAEDIDYENHTIQVVFRNDNENEARAKNAEIRRAKISEGTFQLMILYMTEYRRLLKETPYLFVNLQGETIGEPMNVNAVYSVFGQLEKKTDIKVTPHMLRHYFANERRKKGWETILISKALGHRQIVTTERYMNIEDAEMTAAMDQYYARNGGLYDVERVLER